MPKQEIINNKLKQESGSIKTLTADPKIEIALKGWTFESANNINPAQLKPTAKDIIVSDTSVCYVACV